MTPCLICERAIAYLWPDQTLEDGKPLTNLNNATDFRIVGSYGSSFDTNIYEAIICDDCLDKAIQSKRVSYVGHYL